ncbi:MAG: DUF401 family protein [Promethearchaeota archaeon]
MSDDCLSWIGFFIATFSLIIISKKSIWLALLSSSIILGAFTISFYTLMQDMFDAFFTVDNILLASSMALIPIIGVVLEKSGMLDTLVDQVNIRRDVFNAMAPALVGMLSVPGGALISAPIVNKAAGPIAPETKTALNVWFRHVLFIIYPISSTMIISTNLAGINKYSVILALVPIAIIVTVLGFIFFLKNLKDNLSSSSDKDIAGFFKPLIVIITTPILDPIFRLLFNGLSIKLEYLSIFISISISLLLAWFWSGFSRTSALTILKYSKAWNFLLFMIFLFFFLNVFEDSGIASIIASYKLHPVVILVILGFVFGFITGRMNLPLVILIPIYLSTFAITTMPLLSFCVLYMSVYTGYILSPVHPCLSVTIEYFKVNYINTVKKMIIPAAILMILITSLSFFARA